MKKFVLNIFLILISANIFAQSDSVAYTGDMVLKDGLYFSYTDMRKNNPFPKENIISAADKSELDFIFKTVSDNKEISVAYNGQPEKVETKKIWGFCQNNTVYINFQGKFYRIPVFGNISNFLGTVEVYNNYNSGFYGGVGVGMGMGYGGMMGAPMPVKQRETRQFIFDFYSGDIMDYTLDNVEMLISRDLKLYEEFMQLKKKKRRDMMMLYVRKYNLTHPVKFPVTS
ncbi:MAG: hypothetical protein ACXVPN_10985 [Bacteroidia bacterium]